VTQGPLRRLQVRGARATRAFGTRDLRILSYHASMPDPAALLTPLGATCLWIVLHGTDWFLTVAGARARRPVAERFPLATGYELNPLFKKDIARGGWITTRFVVTWIGGAVVFGGALLALKHRLLGRRASRARAG
jgi:hypothetical protein